MATATAIDAAFDLLAMDGEAVIRTLAPNSRFTAYEVMRYLWHPLVWPFVPVMVILIWYGRRFQKYWLTNKRMIAASGVLGFAIQSIPLERIADVQLSRSWLQKRLNTASLVVRDVSGSGTIVIRSVDDAAAIQLQILEEAARARGA